MSHYVFSFILFFFLVMFVMFGCYIKEREKKKTEKWGRGVNCEEEMREKKNEMGEGGCMCVVGEKKKERQGVHGWWGKKKKEKKKKKKEMGSGVYVYGGKKGRVEKERRKKN
jgi:hypothetical protein